MTIRWRTVLCLVALGAASACSDSSPTDSPPTDDPPTNDDPPGLEDESASCADAVAMTSSTNSVGGTLYTASGTIDGSGDVDFFSVPITAGEWIQVQAQADPGDNGLDTEVTLFDSDGSTQLAYNDDSETGGGLQSILQYLPLATGTACIAVADVQSTDAELDYELIVLPVDADLYDGFNVDVEPNDGTATAQANLTTFGTGANLSTLVLGAFDSSDDIDVYELNIPDGAVRAQVNFTPSFGADGYGSTTEVGQVEIYESDGSQVYARIDPRTGVESIVAPVSPSTTYFVAVDPPGSGASGDNPFYVLPLSTTATENEREADDVGNDASGSAEMPSSSTFGSQTSYFIGGTLPPPGDTDWWQVSAEAGDEIALFCSSWRIGSGVRDATFSIYDDPGSAPLQSEQESEDSDVAWSDGLPNASMSAITATQSGAHYLRVEGATYDADVSGAFYDCGLHVLEG